MMNLNAHPQKFGGESRRSFLRKTATLAAAGSVASFLKTPVYGQDQAPSVNVAGANERIAVAYIGTGKQGLTHVRLQKDGAQKNNIVQVAACDLYEKHLHEARTMMGLGEDDCYRDHRRLLERNDIDAVVISTVDNWHAQCSIDALEAGKHVFCEKPMTRYLGEAWQVYDAVKKTGKVYVIGSQGCLDPKWHKAAEWVKAGKLGPLVWGQGSYCRNHPKNDEWQFPVDADANETNLDWYRWLGRAPKIPWNPDHYFSWHKYYAYNSGIIGNLLPHRFHPLMLASGNPEFPRRVVCTGTRKVSTNREITDTTHLLAEFPSGLTLVVAGTTVNEQGLPDMLRGRRGTLHFASSQNRVEFKPERIFADESEPEEFHDPVKVEDIQRLEKNFFDCIRSGQSPVADVELAIRAHTVLCLAEMSDRLGLALFFDPATRTIKNGEGKVIPPLTYDSVIPTLPA
ncbi:MAG TPA: Gfo/Idh/MocA family oxidoreductase [Verrucomicrobiota bacterium]|nr:Gfo/Idh/MocA family oxidoreductase [Verrucomicrobiota bacterium]HQB17016.1 Gfo/Idh/MocA family oxidoreductase [Verrucomicrobiota bacterium]